MILTRPEYLDSENYPEWVKRNESLLAGYYLDCGEAIQETGGPGPTGDEWEQFCASQHLLWLQAKEAKALCAGQRAIDAGKDFSWPGSWDEKRYGR
jgi:hypothetical protein